MEIFTFTSKRGNRYDGKYDFIADNKFEAIDMALKFEIWYNKKIKKFKGSIRLNLCNITSVVIKKGFINIYRSIRNSPTDL